MVRNAVCIAFLDTPTMGTEFSLEMTLEVMYGGLTDGVSAMIVCISGR